MVEYFSLDYAPGRYFRCEKFGMTIRDESCAAQYRKHKNGYSKCTGCEVGALHAGERLKPRVSHTTCCRCGRTDLRIVGNRVCVACYNREREFLIGRNAKGKRPVMAIPVRELDVDVPTSERRYRKIGGHRIKVDLVCSRRLHLERVADPVEAALVALRQHQVDYVRPVVPIPVVESAVCRPVQLVLPL